MLTARPASQGLADDLRALFVRVTLADLTTEVVCSPRPVERASAADSGPLAYRVSHRVRLWTKSETPTVVRTSQEGVLPLVS